MTIYCISAFVIFGLLVWLVYALCVAAAAGDDELTRVTGIDHRYH